MAEVKNYEIWIRERITKEKAAAEFIKKITELYFNKGIETVLFRNQLIDQRTSKILNLHEYARKFVGQNITIEDTLSLTTGLVQLELAPARMDIGRLASEWLREKNNYSNQKAFLENKLKNFIGPENTQHTAPKDVVLYGFGRIGRLVARELIAQEGMGEQLRLRAIVTRGESLDNFEKRAALLREDSIHGSFVGTVEIDIDNAALVVNERIIHMISANRPEDIDYTSYGFKDVLIIDNTGAFHDRVSLSRHLQAKGAAMVLLTAPGKGIPNIVHGVNQAHYSPKDNNIYSAASCTTNAVAPILKVISNNFDVARGHIETIHAYTNDQNLVDNTHKKHRRGRAAALNIIITETGASSAIAKVLPKLEGKLTSNAIRVPVPNGSLAILSLEINEKTSREELNDIIRKTALTGDMVEQIKYSFSNELVSSDIIGNPYSSVFDSQATIVAPDGKSMVLYIWYDNEYGYTRQVIRLSKYIAEVRRKKYY